MDHDDFGHLYHNISRIIKKTCIIYVTIILNTNSILVLVGHLI